ncbi:hypothetical protein [Actinoplanes xinjiangensis]|jgi:hypothetical protein|uniref:Uncharacterized protein n=1 Tax=Actinoplanes xinjiangensis TaxID=512350 RepID=A0A316EMR3_9ACTN|nr:hypothetical protein [Actinoplanes xinjiangensis]PWK31024.1 hypothetical protein BC793_13521 [Actinoplanes xinjiangensis]GIF44205.1 hypothetical protein Axi01nite_85160 [Actinoplanes xinjiangensis]
MRKGAFALVVALATAGVAVTGTAAGAATSCGPQQAIEFDTPGWNTDFRVRLCIYHGQPTRGAYAGVSWDDGGDDLTDGDRKFDLLVVHFDLQQGARPVAHGSCDLTRRVNSDRSAVFTCEAAFRQSPQRGGWSTSGYLIYNVDRDGAGDRRIDLTASPVVEN